MGVPLLMQYTEAGSWEFRKTAVHRARNGKHSYSHQEVFTVSCLIPLGYRQLGDWLAIGSRRCAGVWSGGGCATVDGAFSTVTAGRCPSRIS